MLFSRQFAILDPAAAAGVEIASLKRSQRGWAVLDEVLQRLHMAECAQLTVLAHVRWGHRRTQGGARNALHLLGSSSLTGV